VVLILLPGSPVRTPALLAAVAVATTFVIVDAEKAPPLKDV
jgi:hypothetical protein